MRAAIFDLDGLLVDSEPLWRQAEQEIFARLDIELDSEQCAQTTGLRVDEVVAYWYARSPWKGRTPEAVADDITRRVTELVRWTAAALPGAREAIDLMQRHGLELALASSSPRPLIEVALERLAVRQHFAVVHSATEEARGKPDPAVYLSTARQLGTPPEACVALEDSIPGVQSARAAGMVVIAVPSASDYDRPELEVADLKLRSLLDLHPDRIPGLEGPIN